MVVGAGAVVVVCVGTVEIKAKSILPKTPKHSSFRNRQPIYKLSDSNVQDLFSYRHRIAW